MGRAFLLLITLESATSLELSAVLDNVKRIVYSYFIILHIILLVTKLQKKVVMSKKKSRNVRYSNYF